MKSVRWILVFLLVVLASPLRAQSVDEQPDSLPAGPADAIPGVDEVPARKATKWRRKQGKPVTRPAEEGDEESEDAPKRSRRGSATRGLRGPEAALEPAPGTGEGFYKAPGTEVKISGDTTNPLGGDVVEVIGHVRLERRGMVLSSDRIRLDRKKGEFVATGNVVVADPRYTLSCGRLVFYSGQEMGVAWDAPRIVETRRDGAGEIADRTEMTAFQITVFTTEQRIEGLERVRIYRMVRRDGKLDLDFKVTADSCDTNMVNRQSVFKGQVKVESPSYQVEAKRLIFDQLGERFTGVGDAIVTGYAADGKPSSKIAGNKIMYLIRERRAIVMGGVTAALQPARGSGMRALDAAAVKDVTPSEELLALPEAPKDPEKDRFRRKSR